MVPSKQEMDFTAEPLRQVPFAEIVKLPVMEQQYGSLTPLEKAQVGILLAASQPGLIVETGVWRGRTTRFMAEFLLLNKMDGKVHGFDLPEVLDELQTRDPWFGSTDNVKLMPGSLPGSLTDWLATHQQPVDFALVDAYHSYHAVYKELSALAPRLSEHGYIFCHDYGRPGSKYEGVMCAVNEVAEKHRMAVLPLWSGEADDTDRFCQAAILHRQVNCSMPRKLFHWRKYFAQEYPQVASLWGWVRTHTLGD